MINEADNMKGVWDLNMGSVQSVMRDDQITTNWKMNKNCWKEERGKTYKIEGGFEAKGKFIHKLLGELKHTWILVGLINVGRNELWRKADDGKKS